MHSGSRTLLTAISSLDNLYHAWQEVRARADRHASSLFDPGAWVNDPAEALQRLGAALRAGRYSPSPLHAVELPKPSGGRRRILVAPPRDRIVERAVHRVLDPLLDPAMSPWSFGYRPGLCVADAIDTLAQLRDEGASWLVRADIAECFEAIPRDAAVDVLARYVDEPAVLALVTRLLTRPHPRPPVGPQACPGLPPGTNLAPLLANLYLTQLDHALLARGAVVVRYADDLAMPASTRAAATAEASRLALTLRAEKTSIVPLAQGIDFLGVHFIDELPRRHRSRPLPPAAKALYVARLGACVGLRSGRVTVQHRSDTLLSVPAAQVGRIVAQGPVQITTGLRSHALRNGLDIVFLTRHGRFAGRLVGSDASASRLRRSQYRIADDADTKLEVARLIVAGKIANQRALLLRRARRGHRRAPRSGRAEAGAVSSGQPWLPPRCKRCWASRAPRPGSTSRP
jgi:CRISPR-associated protein Cas1